MKSTVPVLLFCMAAPVTQAVELRSVHPVPSHVAAPSVAGALFGHDLAPTEIPKGYAGQATWLTETQDRPALLEILAYAALQPGWDGDRGRPGMRWSIDAAVAFMSALPADIEDPVPMISSAGEIAIYWMRGSSYAEVGFDQAGTCFLFAEAPGMKSKHLDEKAPDDPILVAGLREALGFVESSPLAA